MLMPVNKHIKFAVFAVDVALFRIHGGTLEVLLGDVSSPHFKGMRGLIGGLINPNETGEGAVSRLLKMKAGISSVYLEQLQTFSEIDRDPKGRVVSTAYIALTYGDPRRGRGEANTKWVSVSDVGKLAYDHNHVLKIATERLRAKLGYTNIARSLLPTSFTLTELQKTYEEVLGKPLDKRNFRRKLLNLKVVVSTGKKTNINTRRPAELFKFASNKSQIIEIL
jgi:8-oxo-dGTP diphosphatase